VASISDTSADMSSVSRPSGQGIAFQAGQAPSRGIAWLDPVTPVSMASAQLGQKLHHQPA